MLHRRTTQRIPIIADKWIKLDSSIELYNYCDNPYYLFSPQHSLSGRDGDNYILATVCSDKKGTEWHCNVALLRDAAMPNFPPSAEELHKERERDGCNPAHPGRSKLQPHLFTPGPNATDEFCTMMLIISVCIRHAFSAIARLT